MYTQGPVPLADPAYATRDFEEDLARNLNAGSWVLLLGPRQHGKTSALIRLRKALDDAGTSVAFVDLQSAPPFQTYADLVRWFCSKVSTDLGGDPLNAQVEDMQAGFDSILPEGKFPVVVLADEASNIANDEWRNSFFGQLRAISSERAFVPDEKPAKRLRFLFSGTFRPETLINEANSPFNICERVETTDLTVHDVRALEDIAGLANPEEVANAIYEEVGGQPYLVQKLIRAVQNADDEMEALAKAIAEWRTGASDHIQSLFGKVLSDPGLTQIASTANRSGSAPNEAGDPDFRFAQVIGLMKREGRNLVFRNRLYATIAANSPALAEVVAAAQQNERIVLIPVEPDAFSFVASNELREIAYKAQVGAVGAYKAGSNRLALAGYGGAAEALLIDFLKRQSVGDIATAAAACQLQGGENAADPQTWRLVNLMSGSRALLGTRNREVPEALRDWRNLIHPAVCLQDYKPDEVLAPEVAAAAGLFQMLLRDLV